MKDKAEVLAPAGDLKKLKTALLYGADAVYAGTSSMSLRSQSGFSLEDLKEGMSLVRKHKKKLYLTMNLFSHNSDYAGLEEYTSLINSVNPDGVLVADPGIFAYLKKHTNVNLHISTQANVCSHMSVNFWKDQGAALCVLAREVSFGEMKEIKERCGDIKIEAFVHGSMCMTYSGRCLLSNFMSERGANQGNCSHSCRWSYKLKAKPNLDKLRNEIELNEDNMHLFDFFLEEQFRPGEYYQIEEDEFGSYILNSKDLCLMPALKDYLDIGINTLKIEGRNKSEYYTAITSRAYKMAVSDYYKDKDSWDYRKYMDELNTIHNRGYTMAFHSGRLENIAHNYDRTRTLSNYMYAGIVEEVTNSGIYVAVRNHLVSGDILEIVLPTSDDPIRIRMYEYINASNGEKMASAAAGAKNSQIFIPFSIMHNEDLDYLREAIKPLTVIRKEVEHNEFFNQHIKMDRVMMGLEAGSVSSKHAMLSKEKFENPKDNNTVSPRVGYAGCCSRGCNGCLPFWNDDKYAKLREKMKLMPTGTRLPKALINM